MTSIRRLTALVHNATVGSVFTGLLGQAATLVSGILVARILGVENRGHLALLAIIPVVLTLLGSLGLPMAATYFIAKDQQHVAAIVRSLLRPALVQATVLVVLHAILLEIVFGGEPRDVRIAGLVTLAWVPASLAQQYGLAILQGERRFRLFNALRLMPPVAYALAVVLATILGFRALPEITFAWVTSTVVIGLITLRVALRGLKYRSSDDAGPSRVEMLRFGVRGLLGSVSPVETFQVDQAIVGFILSPASLGLYVVGLAFTNLPRMIAGSIGMVAYPRVAAQRDRGDAWGVVRRTFWLVFAISATIVAVMELLIGWLVPLLYGPEFSGAVPLARILLLSALFLSVRRILSDGARGAGRPTWGSAAEITSWVVLIPALAALTPRWGAQGVAIAVVLSSAASLCSLGTMTLVVSPTVRPDEPLPNAPSLGARQEQAGTWHSLANFSRTNLGIIIVATTTIAAGISLAYLSPAVSTVALIAITITLLAPLLVRMSQRRFDPFEPLTIFVGAWFLMFVLRPIAMLVTDTMTYLAYDISRGFESMLILALIGCVGFVTGYAMPWGRRLALRIPALPSAWHVNTAVAYSLTLAVIGLSLFFVFIMQTGGLNALSSVISGRRAGVSLYEGVSGYLYGAIFFLLPAALLMISSGQASKHPIVTLVGIAVLSLVVLRVGPSGTRSWIIPVFGSVLALPYLYRQKRPGLVMITTSLAIGFIFLISFLVSARNVTVRQQEGSFNLVVDSITQPQDMWTQFILGSDTAMAPLLALEIQVVPTNIPFRYGLATGQLVVRPIPRQLWENKPVAGDELLTRLLFHSRQITTAPLQFTPMANFYMDFGFYGVGIGMLVLGIVGRLHYEYLMVNQDSRAVQVLYAATFLMWPVLLRGSVNDTIARLLFIVPPLIIGIYASRTRTNRTAKSLQNVASVRP